MHDNLMILNDLDLRRHEKLKEKVSHLLSPFSKQIVQEFPIALTVKFRLNVLKGMQLTLV